MTLETLVDEDTMVTYLAKLFCGGKFLLHNLSSGVCCHFAFVLTTIFAVWWTSYLLYKRDSTSNWNPMCKLWIFKRFTLDYAGVLILGNQLSIIAWYDVARLEINNEIAWYDVARLGKPFRQYSSPGLKPNNVVWKNSTLSTSFHSIKPYPYKLQNSGHHPRLYPE